MKALDLAISILRSGGLVAFPTETVYGLGADATNPSAVARIFAAKGRPDSNPLIAHVANTDIARKYAAEWPTVADTLATHFWPGPLTLVVRKTPHIADTVTAGKPTVGLRVPDHPLALQLLRAFAGPLAAPSANRSNRVSPTTAQHVRDELGDAIDLILDGGPSRVGIESTVLDLTSPTPTILRLGGVSQQQLEQLIGPVHLSTRPTNDGAPASPGQLPVHYSPITPAYRFETSQRGKVPVDLGGAKCGIMVLSPLVGMKKFGPIIAMSQDPIEYAQNLYDVMRELDAMDLAAIFIEVPPDEPHWAAIRDRILRATTPI